MRLIRFFPSTFKGNYELDQGVNPLRVPARPGLLFFHYRQRVDEFIQVFVEVHE